MSLPNAPLPTRSLVFDDTTLEVRGLSRPEALGFGTRYSEDALPGVPLAERADLAEVYILALGTGIDEATVKTWRDTTDPAVVDTVITAIYQLSGLTKDAQTDPKSAMSETS